MFEIDMQSDIPDTTDITNTNVFHDDSEQAGDFTASDAGLQTNLNNLPNDPDAITVICKFKNDTDTTTGILFHIGTTFSAGGAFGIDISYSQDLLYLYTWSNDHTYTLSDLNLRTQWNEIVAIYDKHNSNHNDKLQLYLNGVKQIPKTYASSPIIDLSSNKNLYVGYRVQSSDSIYWSGYMKHIQVFNKVIHGIIHIKRDLLFPYANDPYQIQNFTPPTDVYMDNILQKVQFRFNSFVNFTGTMALHDSMYADKNTIKSFDIANSRYGTSDVLITNYNFKDNTDFVQFFLTLSGSININDIIKFTTYAKLTFYRELTMAEQNVHVDGTNINESRVKNTYKKFKLHLSSSDITGKMTIEFTKLNLLNINGYFHDYVVLKYRNYYGRFIFIQFGKNSAGNIVFNQYDNEEDAYTMTYETIYSPFKSGILTFSSGKVAYDFNIYESYYMDNTSFIDLIYFTSNDETPADGDYGITLSRIIDNRESFHSEISTSVQPYVPSLTNTITISDSSTIYDWEKYSFRLNGVTVISPIITNPFKSDGHSIDMSFSQLLETQQITFEIIRSDDDHDMLAGLNAVTYKKANAYTISAQNFTGFDTGELEWSSDEFDTMLSQGSTTPQTGYKKIINTTTLITETIGDVNNEYIFIELTGYIKVSRSGNYKFSVAVDKQCFIWIGEDDSATPLNTTNAKIAIFSSSGSYTSGSNFTLHMNILYPIRILTYAHSGGAYLGIKMSFEDGDFVTIHKKLGEEIYIHGPTTYDAVTGYDITTYSTIRFYTYIIELPHQVLTPVDFNLSPISYDNQILVYKQFGTNIILHNTPSLNFWFNYTKFITSSGISYNTSLKDISHSPEYQAWNHSGKLLGGLNYTGNTIKTNLILTLTNTATGESTTIDSEKFIIHKVDFNAFHTPTINSISNINYFKEKTFRFTVSENFYSFTFDVNTYTTEDIINSGTQIIDSSDKSSFPKPIVVTNPSTAVIDVNIMDYLFTNGDNNLKFTIKNTLNGVTSIYNTTNIQQEITSIPETITLNVESDAIISCIPS